MNGIMPRHQQRLLLPLFPNYNLQLHNLLPLHQTLVLHFIQFLHQPLPLPVHPIFLLQVLHLLLQFSYLHLCVNCFRPTPILSMPAPILQPPAALLIPRSL